jgi:probable rRNA maturation factor
LKINFDYQKSKRKFIYSRQAQQIIYQLIKSEGCTLGPIAIVFTNNPEILSINEAFLKHLYFTDVITFNYSIKRVVSGDIFISLEQVTENAKLYNSPAIEELFRVIIHGILHLIGYSDQRDEDRKMMRLKEDQYLCKAKEFINLESDESVL